MWTNLKLVSAVIAVGILLGGAAQTAQAGGFVPPANSKYTIVLLRYGGPNFQKRCKKDVEELRKATGLTDMYVINDEATSTVYYGGYKAVNASEDRDEATRAKRDLDKLVAIDVNGVRPFSGAIVMPMPSPDPDGNPAWDLRNAVGKYSLQIAAYKDNPERKQAAVDSVRDARKMGVEAYYFHGPTTSSVCLGAFPAEALTESKPDAKGRPDQEIIVVPYMPPGMKDEVRQADGTSAKIVEHRFRANEQMMMLMKQYRTHSVNGVEQKLPNGEMASSFVVDIGQVRQQAELMGGGTAAQGGTDGAGAAQTVMPRPRTPGSGKLQSIQ